MPHNLPTPEAMYTAVTHNDADYDGIFVYAVQSTGIYCRPSCASRDPKPENVRYFRAPAEATAAGFRACKRCQPDRSAPDTVAHRIADVIAYIEHNLNTTDLSLEALGAAFCISPYHLQRTFKAATGVSPKVYEDGLRAGRFKAGLRDGASVTDAIYAAGYSSSSRLYERVADELGMTPTVYSTGGAGEVIGYAVAPCALGVVLVAATSRGLCSVQLGDDAGTLITQLETEFPQAQCRPDDARLGTALGAVLAHIAGDLPEIDLPLDVQATAFQRQVWDALRRIPYGETRSYGEVAASIGKPGAARAVGSACGANPIALVVPCHRVTRSDGEPGSYRWGAARKRRILAAEHNHTDVNNQ